MPCLKITPHDILTSRLRLVLEQIVERDDPEADFPELRSRSHRELQEILEEGERVGYTKRDLYEYVVGMEEGRADVQADRDLAKKQAPDL